MTWSRKEIILAVVALCIAAVLAVRLPGMISRYRKVDYLCHNNPYNDPQAYFMCRDKWPITIFGYPKEI